MSKGLNPRKNTLKKPAMTLKEKRAAKHAKKEQSQHTAVSKLTAPDKHHV